MLRYGIWKVKPWDPGRDIPVCLGGSMPIFVSFTKGKIEIDVKIDQNTRFSGPRPPLAPRNQCWDRQLRHRLAPLFPENQCWNGRSPDFARFSVLQSAPNIDFGGKGGRAARIPVLQSLLLRQSASFGSELHDHDLRFLYHNTHIEAPLDRVCIRIYGVLKLFLLEK